jgi:hypothetical protein
MCVGEFVHVTEISMTYSQADFIRASMSLQPMAYDYSATTFMGVCHGVTVVCPEHGPFTQRAEHHMKGRIGCAKCKGLRVGKHRVQTHTQFVEKATLKHGSKYDYSLVPTSGDLPTRVRLVCPKHGEFVQRRYDHLAGKGCRLCSVDSRKHGYKEAEWFGRSIRYQGYELDAAYYLVDLKGIDPDEIIFSMDSKTIPMLRLTGGQRIFPDMWVPSRNLLVEVKSTYTFSCDRKKILRARAAANSAGYNYAILVMDENGDRLAGYGPGSEPLTVNRPCGNRTKPATILRL